MKRLAIMAGLVAVAFSGALVSDSALTGSYARITTTINPGGQTPPGQQASDKEDGGLDTTAVTPAGRALGGS